MSAGSTSLNATSGNGNVFRTQYGTLTRGDPGGLAELAGMTAQGGSSSAHNAKLQEEEEDEDADLGIFETGSGDENDEDTDEEGGKKRRAKRSKATPGGGSATQGDGKGEADSATGRRKIRIEFIEDDSRRHITFSKRKAGIMKKAYELATLTGTQILLLVVSQTGLVYTFTTPKLAPVVKEATGKELIRSCLASDDYDHGDVGDVAPTERKKGGEQMPREPSAAGKRKRSTASSTSRRNAAAAASAAVGESMSRQGSGSSSSDQYSHDSNVGDYARASLSSQHLLQQGAGGSMSMMSGGPHSSPLVGSYGLPGLPYYSPSTASYDFGASHAHPINHSHQAHLSPHSAMYGLPPQSPTTWGFSFEQQQQQHPQQPQQQQQQHHHPHSQAQGGSGGVSMGHEGAQRHTQHTSTVGQAVHQARAAGVHSHLLPYEQDAAQQSLGLNLGSNQWSLPAGAMGAISSTDLHRQNHLSPHGYTTALPKTDATSQAWTRS